MAPHGKQSALQAVFPAPAIKVVHGRSNGLGRPAPFPVFTPFVSRAAK
jgi:hypothetical protein